MSTTRSPEHSIFDFERDVTVQGGQRFRHPTAAFFHVAFKLLAILIYMFGGLFDFLTAFVVLIFLISIDFWVVKNVSGRLLAGLRWWNYVDEEGHSHWMFENRHANDQDDPLSTMPWSLKSVDSGDAKIFWFALILTPLIWLLFLILSIFRFNIHWFVVVALALVLSLSNLYGYIRCKFGSRDIKSTFAHFVGKRIFLNFMNSPNSGKTNTSEASSFVNLTTR